MVSALLILGLISPVLITLLLWAIIFPIMKVKRDKKFSGMTEEQRKAYEHLEWKTYGPLLNEFWDIQIRKNSIPPGPTYEDLHPRGTPVASFENESLADKVDTRFTNIFKNPWEDIL